MNAPAPQRVLLTRSSEDNRDWMEPLAREGYVGVDMPCIQCAVIPDAQEPLQQALAQAQALLFTSARAVRALTQLCPEFDLTNVLCACVGESTAKALQAAGGRCEFVPAESTGQALAQAWIKRMPSELRVLWPAAQEAQMDLMKAFEVAGRDVQQLPIYTTGPASEIDRTLLPKADAIFFASPSAVSALFATGSLPARLAAISIGPSTTQALRAHSVTITAEARTRSLSGLLAAWQAAPANTPPLPH